jgi:hypothetical protein
MSWSAHPQCIPLRATPPERKQYRAPRAPPPVGPPRRAAPRRSPRPPPPRARMQAAGLRSGPIAAGAASQGPRLRPRGLGARDCCATPRPRLPGSAWQHGERTNGDPIAQERQQRGDRQVREKGGPAIRPARRLGAAPTRARPLWRLVAPGAASTRGWGTRGAAHRTAAPHRWRHRAAPTRRAAPPTPRRPPPRPGPLGLRRRGRARPRRRVQLPAHPQLPGYPQLPRVGHHLRRQPRRRRAVGARARRAAAREQRDAALRLAGLLDPAQPVSDLGRHLAVQRRLHRVGGCC